MRENTLSGFQMDNHCGMSYSGMMILQELGVPMGPPLSGISRRGLLQPISGKGYHRVFLIFETITG